tara:strand:- start:2529 stop:2894 length:366 start_codon:yes stop_codon:yes gene_type:complete
MRDFLAKYISPDQFVKNLRSINSLDGSPDFKSLFISLFILYLVTVTLSAIPFFGELFSIMFFPLVLIFLYVLAAIPLNIARSKNMVEDESQVMGWLIFGFLFFFIALIYVLIAEKKEKKPE